MPKAKIGPWTENYTTMHPTGRWHRGVPGDPACGGIWVPLAHTVGLEYTKSGVRQPGPPYYAVTPASLTRKSVLMTEPCNLIAAQNAYCSGKMKYDVVEDHVLPSSTSWDNPVPSLINRGLIIDNAKDRVRSKTEALYDVGVSLGEFDETVNFLKNGANALVSRHNKATQSLSKNIRTFLRSPKLTAFKIARNLADGILAYNFGIAPLVGEVQSAAESLAALETNWHPELKPRSRKSVTASNIITLERPIAAGIYGWYTLSETVIEEYTYGAGAVYNAFNSIGGLSSQALLGVDPTHPLGFLKTIYEVTPYSWLLDYFMNLNQYLSAFTFDDRLLSNPWEISLFKRTVDVVFRSWRTDPAYTIQTPGSGRAKYTFFQFNRGTTSFSALPSNLRFKVPGVMQATNTLALLTTRVVAPEQLKSPRINNLEVRSLINNLLLQNRK